MAKRIDFPFEIRPLLAEEGGGFLIAYPDFSNCISNGETVEQAMLQARLATCAKAESVSLNTLVLTFIAEGPGRKERRV